MALHQAASCLYLPSAGTGRSSIDAGDLRRPRSWNAFCHTPSLVTSNLIALAGALVLLAVVLLLLALASTGLGLVYASITVGSAALVSLGLGVLVRSGGARGRHVRRARS